MMTQKVAPIKTNTGWTVYEGEFENTGKLAGTHSEYADFDTKKEADLYCRYLNGKISKEEYEEKSFQMRYCR